MIHHLHESLKKLLVREVALVKGNIFFGAPDVGPGDQLAVNLFLYDIRENRELRSTEWQVERQGSAVTKKRPPVRVDCSYLITAYSGDPESEYQILSQVMEVLLRYPTLPATLLVDDLRGQVLPLPVGVLQPGRLQSVGEFWQALGGKPKAVLHYTVTLSVDAQTPVDMGPPVVDSQINMRQIKTEQEQGDSSND
jgi:hypothetical protein